MKEQEAMIRIKDLLLARDLYSKFLTDSLGVFFGDNLLKELLKKTDKEIFRLEELLYNGELEDSKGSF